MWGENRPLPRKTAKEYATSERRAKGSAPSCRLGLRPGRTVAGVVVSPGRSSRAGSAAKSRPFASRVGQTTSNPGPIPAPMSPDPGSILGCWYRQSPGPICAPAFWLAVDLQDAPAIHGDAMFWRAIAGKHIQARIQPGALSLGMALHHCQGEQDRHVSSSKPERVATASAACVAVSPNTAFDAPRALIAPAFCGFSHLKNNAAPFQAPDKARGHHRHHGNPRCQGFVSCPHIPGPPIPLG